MQIDPATPPLGFAQNGSIAEGFEISNGNERRIQSFTCVANPTQLDSLFSAPHEGLVNGVFSDISHHIVPRVNGFAHISIIYPKNSNASVQIQHPESKQEIMFSQTGRKNDFSGSPYN